MAAPPTPPPPVPLEPVGEYLFKQGELVFGPVPGSVLIEKLRTGELAADTLVAREGAAFSPIGEVTVFMTHAAKASARRRVDEQAKADARRRKRRRSLRLAAVALAASIGAAGAVAGVIGAIRSGVFERSYEELADIEILASPPLVAVAPGGQVAEDELEYVDEDRPGGAGVASGRRPARNPGSPGRAPAGVDEMRIEAQYDQGSIQAVVRANQHRLYPCLKEQASRDPTFRGDVPFSFTVGNQGKVVKLWIDRAGFGSGPLFKCMETQLAQWRFPTFEGERPSVSLSFRVGGG